MKTFKEFVAILERFKPFPEDKVSRNIQKKKSKRGDDHDIHTHRMNIAKNFATKLSNKTSTNRYDAARTVIRPTHVNNAILNTLQGNHSKARENLKRQKGVEFYSKLVNRAKPEDIKTQIDTNIKNKDNKNRLNRILRDEN